MTKIKKQSYGFSTPVRRTTNNVTGNKVGGDYSGGDCKIERFSKIELKGRKRFDFTLNADDSIKLFNKNISIVAIGGYFLSSEDVEVTMEIDLGGVRHESKYSLSSNVYDKLGFDLEYYPDMLDPGSTIRLSIQFESKSNYNIQYTRFSYKLIDFDYYISNDVYKHFFNSKSKICIPEQYYFSNDIILDDSVDGDVIINKSCNRCQRFLPINHFKERVQLGFSNHCSTKAPCTHKLFSNYLIRQSCLDDPELKKYIKTTDFTLKDNFIISYHGHQLECKACKKFFVNSALNHLRSSTQHREDSLRRRAFEQLVNTLLESKWIYHTFRIEKELEFDKYIWEKFKKKCFNCATEILTPNDMDLDHTMPLVYLYPLDETATCLCPKCNSAKSGMFPVDFYKPEQLVRLSKITGLSLEILNSKSANEKVILLLKKKVVWFFDTFLTFPEYTKDREGKKASDSILHSIQKVLNKSKNGFDLLEEYGKEKDKKK